MMNCNTLRQISIVPLRTVIFGQMKIIAKCSSSVRFIFLYSAYLQHDIQPGPKCMFTECQLHQFSPFEILEESYETFKGVFFSGYNHIDQMKYEVS